MSDILKPNADYTNFLIDIGFGKNCPAEQREYWNNEIAKNYTGEEGRKRIRMAAINLRDRDGLHMRASDVKCPVLWLHVSFPIPSLYISGAQHMIDCLVLMIV
jgi:hypothetical protein